MYVLKNERGFSLVEVVAAIVIITLVLLSFSKLFIQTNTLAHKNNEKLVTINLADAMLVRLKSESFSHNPSFVDPNHYFIDASEPDQTKKRPPTLIKLNGREYSVIYKATQDDTPVANATYSEKVLKLVKVVVTVTAPDGKTKGSSEGYVALE